MNYLQTQNPEVLDKLRDKFILSIRRSKREKHQHDTREKTKTNLFTKLQTQQKEKFPLIISQAQSRNFKPLEEFIQFHLNTLDQEKIKTIIDIIMGQISLQSLGVLESLSKHSEFRNIIKQDYISLLIKTSISLNQSPELISSPDLIKTLDNIYAVIGKIHPRIPDDLVQTLLNYINNKEDIVLTKPLIHLYYIFRKSYSTIVKGVVFDRLISQKMIASEDISVQMRVNEIVKTSIGYQQLNQQQLMSILNNFRDIINLQIYHKDVKTNTYQCLSELVSTSSSWIIQRIARHPIFYQILKMCSMSISKGIEIICVSIITTVIQQSNQETLKHLFKSLHKQIIYVILTNINGHDIQKTLRLLSAVYIICQKGWKQQLINQGILQILNTLQQSRYREVYSCVSDIIDECFPEEFTS